MSLGYLFYHFQNADLDQCYHQVTSSRRVAMWVKTWYSLSSPFCIFLIFSALNKVKCEINCLVYIRDNTGSCTNIDKMWHFREKKNSIIRPLQKFIPRGFSFYHSSVTSSVRPKYLEGTLLGIRAMHTHIYIAYTYICIATCDDWSVTLTWFLLPMKWYMSCKAWKH